MTGNRVHAGPYTGAVVAVVTYADWEAFGKAQQALAKDSEYQTLMAQAATTAELISRRISVGLDL